MIIAGGVAVPALVLSVVTAVSAWPGLRDSDAADIHIEVEGQQFWWSIRYPDHGIITANEIHIPVGRPVALALTSRDVIHSLWIPQLAGKLDLLPERTNHPIIEADEPGIYWGECAEFCGIAHAHMRLVVIAEEPAVYERWLADQAANAVEPSTPLELRGSDVFLESCAQCHTIRGAHVASDNGPDLTHLASRIEIGAGTLDNEPQQLADWVTSTQRHKPGSLMPSVPLSDADLAALLAYLKLLE